MTHFSDRLLAVYHSVGGSSVEDDLLHTDVALVDPVVSTPGVNTTLSVLLTSGTNAFLKPFSGVNVPTAGDYDHHPDDVPLNEVIAWYLARRLGSPWDTLVSPCVLRTVNGESGSLSRLAVGEKRRPDAIQAAPDKASACAFFDALIGQQDRHTGNFRFSPGTNTITLIDHGYSFPRAKSPVNATIFVEARAAGLAGMSPDLSQFEIDALNALLGSPGHYDLADMLLADRYEALIRRATAMLNAGQLLARGNFAP